MEDFQGAGRPTWPGGYSCAGLRQPAGLPAMGQAIRRREEGEDDGIDAQKTKTAGTWVKKKLKVILPSVKSKIFEYHFCSNFQNIHFLLYDIVRLSNA
jgi:hypothetical protein